jgi:uncharacterized membrane protein YdjX (TVP38/TMEM64 family)
MRPMTPPPPARTPALRRSWHRLWPVAPLLLGLVLFFALGLQRYVSFEALSRDHALLAAWVAEHRGLAECAYVAIYAALICCSLPVAIVLTAMGGFLFGTWLAAALAVTGQTLGSTIMFVAAGSAFRDLFQARAGDTAARLEAGFRRNSFVYILCLRLLPIVPYWVVNVSAALLGARLDRFVPATFLGILPGICIYAGVGAGFGALFETGERPDLVVAFEGHLMWPLLGLALLALLPVAYLRWRGGRRRS